MLNMEEYLKFLNQSDKTVLKALEVLENCDVLAAEDTRHTQKLLMHFGIKKPLISYYEHNKTVRGPVLIEKLANGENIALVSDAGTSCIAVADMTYSHASGELGHLCFIENLSDKSVTFYPMEQTL